MELPKIIVSSVRTGRVVLFLGSGVLLGSKLPNGKQLISEESLRDALSENFLSGEHGHESLQWVAELAISGSDLSTVQNFIASKFRGIQPADFHLILPTFKWKYIITTNFDRLVETTYEQSKNKVQKLVPIISNNDRLDRKLQSSDSLALLKLHGCITRTQDPNLPLILSTDQYPTHKQGRERLFKTLYELCCENTVIFIGGGSSKDVELRSILLQLLSEVENRPLYYLIQPKTTEAEKTLWKSRRVEVLQGNFEDFIRSLDRSVEKGLRRLAQALKLEHPLERKFIKNEPIVGALKDFLTHDVEYVHDAIEIKESNPKQFYRGFDLGWCPIIQELDVVRRLTDTMLFDVILRPESDRPTISELYLVKAEAGSGKTIFLRRLAWEAAIKADVICLFVKTRNSINFDSIRELHRLTDQRFFVFIDAAVDNIDLILRLLKDARRYQIPLTIITASRTNEWNILCDEQLAEHVSKTYSLNNLSEPEIKTLVKLLEIHNALGPNLENKTFEERVQQFTEKAERQLLVALHEATLGQPFREIIEDEYKRIYPKRAKDMYLTVCFLNRFGAPVRAGLISRIHNMNFEEFESDLFKPLEEVIQVKKEYRNFYYQARHPQIAQIVFEETLSDDVERYNEYIRILKHVNISFDSDRDSFRKLIKAKPLGEIFSSSKDARQCEVSVAISSSF